MKKKNSEESSDCSEKFDYEGFNEECNQADKEMAIDQTKKNIASLCDKELTDKDLLKKWKIGKYAKKNEPFRENIDESMLKMAKFLYLND